MKYALGIDVGTSYTAVATWRLDGRQQNKAEVVPLGNRTTSVASVLFLGAPGSVLVGEAAERRALSDPDRVVREFKRRIGDDTPLFVGGESYAAHDLAATMVRWVVDRVAEREGGPADHIAITHPAGWGPYKKDLLRTALRARGLDELTFLAEPEAAAISYASQERIEVGSTIAVYDLGGGTFDAAVVRKTGAASFTLLGSADGIEQLGGADFDEAVFTHVWAALGAQLSPAQLDALNVEDPSVLTALARLRRECTEAKETLSADTEVSIPVLLPGVSSHVRLGRSEFEEMIRPGLQDTIDSLSRAMRSAGVTNEDLDAVLLVGGSSRIPLVSQLVSAELGCPVVVDADPKATIALGAALSMATQAEPAATTAAPVTETMTPVADGRAPVPAAGDGLAPNRPPVMPVKPESSTGRGRISNDPALRSKLMGSKLVAAALAVVTVGLIGGVLLIPSMAAALGPSSSSAATDGPSATSQVDPPSDAVPDPGDPEKLSIAGSSNGSRGRQDPTGATSPAAGQATGAGAPTDQGTRGGRATTPAPVASSQPTPTVGSTPEPTVDSTPDPTTVPTPDPTTTVPTPTTVPPPPDPTTTESVPVPTTEPTVSTPG